MTLVTHGPLRIDWGGTEIFLILRSVSSETERILMGLRQGTQALEANHYSVEACRL